MFVLTSRIYFCDGFEILIHEFEICFCVLIWRLENRDWIFLVLVLIWWGGGGSSIEYRRLVAELRRRYAVLGLGLRRQEWPVKTVCSMLPNRSSFINVTLFRLSSPSPMVRLGIKSFRT